MINRIDLEKFDMFQNAVETALNKMVGASKYTVFPEKLLKRLHDSGTKIKCWNELATCDLKQLDACNRSIAGFHKKAAAAQGALAGAGGAFVAAAGLTAVLFQAFHMVQEIAFSYGFDPNEIVEKRNNIKDN